MNSKSEVSKSRREGKGHEARQPASSSSSPLRSESWRLRVILAAIAVCTVATFIQVCWNDFTWWDDGYTIHHNPRFNPPSVASILYYWHSQHMGLYIPVTYTLWQVLAFLARVQSADQVGATLNPWVFHWANLAVHVLSAITVFAILRRLLREQTRPSPQASSGVPGEGVRDWCAAAGAILFALHPVQVEAVAWISGMKDLLCGLFTLLAIWQYILFASKETQHKGAHYALATAFFLLGFLSKPTAMVAPVMLLVIDYFLLNRPLRQTVRSLALWVVLLIPLLIVTRNVQPGEGVPTTSIPLRPLIAADTVAFYLYKLVFPLRLTMDYGRNPGFISTHGPMIMGHTVAWIWISWLLPAALAVVIWRLGKKFQFLPAGAWLFVAGMLPTLGLVTFLFQYYSTTADHYLYLPMFGVALTLAFFLRRFDRFALRVACVVVLLVLAVRSSFQCRYWTDDYALYTHELSINPTSAVGNLNLGQVLLQRGEPQQALYYMRRSVEFNPKYYLARQELNRLLESLGQAPTTVPDKLFQQKQ